MQLGGVPDALAGLLVEAERGRRAVGEVGDVVAVLGQFAVAFHERSHECVLGLACRRAASDALVGVHALVGDAKRLDP